MRRTTTRTRTQTQVRPLVCSGSLRHRGASAIPSLSASETTGSGILRESIVVNPPWRVS